MLNESQNSEGFTFDYLNSESITRLFRTSVSSTHGKKKQDYPLDLRFVVHSFHCCKSAALLIIGFYLEYEVACNPPTPTQMNEAIGVSVLIVLALYAVHEYFDL